VDWRRGLALLSVAGVLGLAACTPTVLTEPPGRAAPAPYPALPDRTTAGATRYEIVPENTQVYARVFRGGRLEKLGHNHVVVFNDVRGYVSLAEEPVDSLFDFAVATADVSVDPPALRQRQGKGFDTRVSERARTGTRGNMLSESVLHAAAYPYVMIGSSSIEGTFDDARVTMAVTIRDVTRLVTIPVTLKRGGRRLVASGEFGLLQSDYGIEPFAALGGALKVKDRVELVFNISAERVD